MPPMVGICPLREIIGSRTVRVSSGWAKLPVLQIAAAGRRYTTAVSFAPVCSSRYHEDNAIPALRWRLISIMCPGAHSVAASFPGVVFPALQSVPARLRSACQSHTAGPSHHRDLRPSKPSRFLVTTIETTLPVPVSSISTPASAGLLRIRSGVSPVGIWKRCSPMFMSIAVILAAMLTLAGNCHIPVQYLVLFEYPDQLVIGHRP